MNVYVCVCIYIYIYIYVCVCVCVCVYIYIYIYIHIHIFIAKLVRASRQYREVKDSNPVEALNFSVGKIAFITSRIIASLDSLSYSNTVISVK